MSIFDNKKYAPLEARYKRLDEIQHNPDATFWFELDSAPPTDKTNARVKHFLKTLIDSNIELPALFPLTDPMFSEESEYEDILGGITCEWANKDRFVSVSFLNDNTYECYVLHEDSTDEAFGGSFDFEYAEVVCTAFAAKNV